MFQFFTKIHFRKKITLIFSIILIGITAIGIATFRNNQSIQDTNNLVQHTREVLSESEQVLLFTQDIVLSTRGYVITGDSNFLQPFLKANNLVGENINAIKNLTKDNPAQQLRTDTLAKLIKERIEFSSQTIELLNKKGFAKAQQLVAAGKGKHFMDEIRNTISRLQQEENNLLNIRQQAYAKSLADFNRSFFLLLGGILLLLIIVFFTIRHNTLLREKREAEIQEKSSYIKNNEERINKIMDILLKYTLMDFSQQMEISEKGDALDAIALGLNTLSEELQKHIEQLKGNTKQLAVMNKELESFTYSVSHDLRAPLRGVHAYTKILEEDYFEKLDDEGKKTIGVILRNSKKMGELIDDLLAFSRLGKKEINSMDINMNAMAKTVADEFISSDKENKIEIKIDSLPEASGDAALIKQVWFNLISNAVKYSSNNKKTIIEIGFSPNENKNIYYVKDNGVGFDMEYYNKLFGVFQRLHSQEEFEGTGVGLAIVQRIISKHHGKVWAEATLNEGACFYFSLPPISN